MTYPPHRLKAFERITTDIKAKYLDADLRGKETERNGNEIMINLAFAPKRVKPETEEEGDSDKKLYESTPTSELHDFISALIEEHSN